MTGTEQTLHPKYNPLTKVLPSSHTQKVQNRSFTLIALNQ